VDRETPPLQTLRLDPLRSAVLIDVRSTVGPISFGTTGVSGALEAAIVNGEISAEVAATGSITFDVTALHSGNRLYDAELLRRIDARRYPSVTVKLEQCAAGGPGSRFTLTGEVTFHGVSRAAEGTVRVEALSATRILVTGEQVFDIRDFSLSSPTVLMLRIYPDIRVRLHVEAELEATV
jgi:polyisoprenoid-binding protein YceI